MVADVIARLIGGVILATAGWGLGTYISEVWSPTLFVPITFGLTIAGALVGVVGTTFVISRIVHRVSHQVAPLPNSLLWCD